MSHIKSKNVQVLKELCRINGLDITEVKSKGVEILILEALFFGASQLIGMKFFPNLVTLRLFGQELTSLKPLQDSPNLKELWVCECKSLQNISGLNHCQQLEKVYLFDNDIFDIQQLSSNTNLQILWINNNKIESLKPLEDLKSLCELNIAANRITEFGGTWPFRLKALNVSGNPISSFQALIALSGSVIEQFSLYDQMFCSKPLINPFYTSWLLYHLPFVHSVDGHHVINVTDKTNQAIHKWIPKAKAEARKVEHRSAGEINKLLDIYFEFRHFFVSQLRHLKGSVREDKIVKGSAADSNSRIDMWQCRFEMLQVQVATLSKYFGLICKLSLLSPQISLETCFEFSITTYFSGDDQPLVAAVESSIKAQNCLTILQSLNMDAFTPLLIFQRVQAFQKVPENLPPGRVFFAIKRSLSTDANLEAIVDAMDCGHVQIGTKITRSLFVADQLLVEELATKNDSSFLVRNSISALLIVTPIQLKQVTREFFRFGDKDFGKLPCGFDKHEINHAMFTQFRTSPKNLKVLGVILLHYKWKLEALLPISDILTGSTSCSPSNLPTMFQDDLALDKECIGSLNYTKGSTPSKTATLREYLQLRSLTSATCSTLTQLSLVNSDLKSDDDFDSLLQLVQLNVACNELDSIQKIVRLPRLASLDISYNNVRSIENLKCFDLAELNCRANALTNLVETVDQLSKCKLTVLDIRDNVLHRRLSQIDDVFEAFVCRNLTFLKELNSKLVNDETKKDYPLQKSLTSIVLESDGRFWADLTIPAVLSTKTHTQYLRGYSSYPLKITDENWKSRLTAIDLSNKNIYCIETEWGLNENVRWADVSHNCMNGVESLFEMCPGLEDVDASYNSIYTFEPQPNYTQCLSILNLSHNCLKGNLEFCATLPTLTIFKCDSNQITSLQGVQHCRGLQEFYVSYNQLVNLNDVKLLQEQQNLIHVDLFGNPFSLENRYKKFVIFSLKKLKSCDGVLVTSVERKESEESFGLTLNLGLIERHYFSESIARFSMLTVLKFVGVGLHNIDISLDNPLRSVKSVDLTDNKLKHFGGLVYLKGIEDLVISRNQIRSTLSVNEPIIVTTEDEKELTFLPLLSRLTLESNCIKDITQLKLNYFPALSVLNLRNNLVEDISGFHECRNLMKIDLSRNKIRCITAKSFSGVENTLSELSLAENKIKNLSSIGCLKNITSLNVSSNGLATLNSLDELEVLPKLQHLYCLNNVVSTKRLYVPFLVTNCLLLQVIDGEVLTPERRALASQVYINQDRKLSPKSKSGSRSSRSRKLLPPSNDEEPESYHVGKVESRIERRQSSPRSQKRLRDLAIIKAIGDNKNSRHFVREYRPTTRRDISNSGITLVAECKQMHLASAKHNH